MTWDELYARWAAAWKERRHHDFQLVVRESQKRAAEPSPQGLEWLAEALTDPDRRWFVAMVYCHRSVPRQLFLPMVRAGATDCDASACRRFVEPCVETFGSEAVLAELVRYAAEGGERAALGYRKCHYWVRPSSSFRRGMRPTAKQQYGEPDAPAERPCE